MFIACLMRFTARIAKTSLLPVHMEAARVASLRSLSVKLVLGAIRLRALVLRAFIRQMIRQLVSSRMQLPSAVRRAVNLRLISSSGKYWVNSYIKASQIKRGVLCSIRRIEFPCATGC